MASLETAIEDMTNNPWQKDAETPAGAVERYTEQRNFWLAHLDNADASVFADQYPERARNVPIAADADGWGAPTDAQDMVNHPPHYTSDPSGVECIDITRHRNFNIGNAIKYLWRAGLKDDPALGAREKQVQDLRKAVWYIEDEIKRLGNDIPE